jgi:cell division protein YceG involved in septum cleavage
VLTNKSLLYGLGIGLIIGALLLQLMNITKPSIVKPDLSKGSAAISEMDRAQLKEAATKYYQVFDNDQKLFNQAQIDAIVAQKVKEEKDKQPVAPQQQSDQDAVKETYIYVSNGLNAGNVADLLVQSGVVTDRKAFEDLMSQQQLNQRIVSGVYMFKSPFELSRVVSTITTRQ